MVRLSSLLPSIVSQEHSSFLNGMTIDDNILLDQELIQSVKKKVRGSNNILKLDISKAYDSMSWLALINIMRRFGLMKGGLT